MVQRFELTDEQWERLRPLLPPQKARTGRPATDHRQIINGSRWIIRTGAPWRDLPERHGPWSTVAARFERLIDRLKHFRRLATRYEKRAENYRIMWIIAATILWL